MKRVSERFKREAARELRRQRRLAKGRSKENAARPLIKMADSAKRDAQVAQQNIGMIWDRVKRSNLDEDDKKLIMRSLDHADNKIAETVTYMKHVIHFLQQAEKNPL